LCVPSRRNPLRQSPGHSLTGVFRRTLLRPHPVARVRISNTISTPPVPNQSHRSRNRRGKFLSHRDVCPPRGSKTGQTRHRRLRQRVADGRSAVCDNPVRRQTISGHQSQGVRSPPCWPPA
jgi:hypothetical protein